MNNLIKVALNVSNMSVPQLINRARQISDAIAANPGVFISPTPSIGVVNSAINNLEFAWNEAADGGKSKIAMMHAKKRDLIKQLKAIAMYVEYISDNDDEIVYLATLTVKAKPNFHKDDFEVFLPDDRYAVGLRCKASKKCLYKWEYCKDPLNANQWLLGNMTSSSSSFIGNLESNVMYWFRVVIVTPSGEHVLGPKPAVPL